MTNNYCVTMDDGEVLNIKTTSASEAIQWALAQRVGKKVAKCHAFFKAIRSQMTPSGIINYDIPKHEALTKPAIKRVRAKADLSTPLFPDYKP